VGVLRVSMKYRFSFLSSFRVRETNVRVALVGLLSAGEEWL